MKRALGALVILFVTSVSLYPLCDLVFRCGCATMWSGADARCNVHTRHGAHCPVCDRLALGTFTFLLMLAGQGAVFAVVRRRRGSVPAATLAAVVVLPLAFVFSAGACWLATDYPHFLVENARARLELPAGPVVTVR